MAMPLPGPAEGRRALTEMHDLALQLVIHAPIGAVVLADVTFIVGNHQKHHWPYNVGDKSWICVNLREGDALSLLFLSGKFPQTPSELVYLV